MKILQLANKFPYPPKDGGSIATLSFSKSLVELGHNVTLLAMNTSKHFTDVREVPEDLKKAVRLIEVKVNTDINPFRLLMNYLFSSYPYNAERFVSGEFSKKLEEVLLGEAFDIIQLEGLYLVPYLEQIRKLSSARVVMRAHNIEHEIWQRSALQWTGIKRLYIRNLSKRIQRLELQYLNDYDAILPITERDGEVFRSLGCQLPMHIVPTGVDTGVLYPDNSDVEQGSVFHIGALDWAPNIEGLKWFFERVWPLIIRQMPDLKFYLAGRNAADELRNSTYPNTTFLGEVEDAYAFMKSKAVMIVPVFSGSGMRIKIVEGMSLGKSIVTTPVGTEGINTTNRENIMIADNPEDFAGAIIELLQDKALFNKIGENAFTFVKQNYDHLSITASCTEFFQDLT